MAHYFEPENDADVNLGWTVAPGIGSGTQVLVQQAIDNLAALGGGTLRIPGKYGLTAPIFQKTGVDLVGTGRAISGFVAIAGWAGSGLIRYTGSPSDMQIRHMTLDGAGIVNENFALDTGTGAPTVTRLKLEDLTITNTQHHGIWYRGVVDGELENVLLLTAGRAVNPTAAGIFAEGCANLALRRVISDGSYEHGYYCIGANEDVGPNSGTTILEGCTAKNNGGSGFSIRTRHSTLTGCYATLNNARSSNNPGFNFSRAATGLNTSHITMTACIGWANANAVTELSITWADEMTVATCVMHATTLNARAFDMPTGSSGNRVTISNTEFISDANNGNEVARINGTWIDVTFDTCTIRGDGTGTGLLFDAAANVTRVSYKNGKIQNVATGVSTLLGGTIAAAPNGVNIHRNEFTTVTTRFNFAAAGTGAQAWGNDPTRATGGYLVPNILAGAQDIGGTLAVPGAALGDVVEEYGFSLNLQGITLTAYVSAAAVVTFVFQNGTGGAINLGQGVLRCMVSKGS